MKYKIITLQILFYSSLAFLNGCSDSSSSFSSSLSDAMRKTSVAVNGLTTSGHTVNQGSAFLFQSSNCPQFVAIFDSCFGNNAASPYVFPQVPNVGSYVDPAYAAPFNYSGPGI